MVELNLAFFEKCLGDHFKVAVAEDKHLLLRLADVRKKESAPQWQCFSVYFEGPRETMLTQQVVNMVHEQDGREIAVFLVPVEGGEDFTLYEAVYNIRHN